MGMSKNIEKTGSPGKTRTCDIWINSPPFYQLNYRGSQGSQCYCRMPFWSSVQVDLLGFYGHRTGLLPGACADNLARPVRWTTTARRLLDARPQIRKWPFGHALPSGLNRSRSGVRQPMVRSELPTPARIGLSSGSRI